MAELTYNVTEAAEALGISRRSVYELMNRADFPCSLKLGGRRLISKELLSEWVKTQALNEAALRVSSTQSGKKGEEGSPNHFSSSYCTRKGGNLQV